MEVERPSASYIIDVGSNHDRELGDGLMTDRLSLFSSNRCPPRWRAYIRPPIAFLYGIYTSRSASRRSLLQSLDGPPKVGVC